MRAPPRPLPVRPAQRHPPPPPSRPPPFCTAQARRHFVSARAFPPAAAPSPSRPSRARSAGPPCPLRAPIGGVGSPGPVSHGTRPSAPGTQLRSPRPTRPGAVAAAPRDCAHRCPGGARSTEHFKASAKCTMILAGRRLINSRASSRLSHEYADEPRWKAGRHVTKALPPLHHPIGRDLININEPRRGATVGARKQNRGAAPPPPPTWGRGAMEGAHWLRARRRAGAPL